MVTGETGDLTVTGASQFVSGSIENDAGPSRFGECRRTADMGLIGHLVQEFLI